MGKRSYVLGVLVCSFALVAPSLGVEDKIASTCATITKALVKWNFVQEAFERAHSLHPTNPVARSLVLPTKLPKTSEFPATKVIPFVHDPSRPFPANAKQQGSTPDWLIPETPLGKPPLRAIPSVDLNTIRYFAPRDIRVNGKVETFERPVHDIRPGELTFRGYNFHPHKGTRIVINWTAGHTGLFSNAGRVFQQVKTMNSEKPNGITMSMLKGENGENPYWIETAASTGDIPFHGSGPSGREFLSLEMTTEWRRRYFQTLKDEARESVRTEAGDIDEAAVPKFVSASRSGEPIPICLLNEMHPGLLDGMILFSPMHPSEGWLESLDGYANQSVIPGQVPYNALAFDWLTGLRNQIMRSNYRWWERDKPTGGTPTLIMVGANDPQVSVETRAAFRAMARKDPDSVFYVEVPNAGHDMFAIYETARGEQVEYTTSSEERAARAWTYVYWFLNTQVLKQYRPVPPHGWMEGQ